MTALWQVYGRSVRGVMLALAVLYAASSGGLVPRGDPVTGSALAWTTWAAASACFVAVAWWTRAPSPAPALLAATLLVAYVALPATAAWLPTTMSVLLVYVAFTSSVRTTVALMLAWMATYTVVLLARDAAGADLVGQVAGSTAALTGLVISTALRAQAARLLRQQRRTDAALEGAVTHRAVAADRRRTVEPAARPAREVLADLAEGRADPASAAVRERCRVAEGRLRTALVAAADGGELHVLAAELVSLSDAAGVVVHAQGEDSWQRLPAAERRELARAAAHLVRHPGLVSLNLTLLPDDRGVWVSLGGAGTGRPPEWALLSGGRLAPRRTGRHEHEWWQQWVVPLADTGFPVPTPVRAPAPRKGVDDAPADQVATVSGRPR